MLLQNSKSALFISLVIQEASPKPFLNISSDIHRKHPPVNLTLLYVPWLSLNCFIFIALTHNDITEHQRFSAFRIPCVFISRCRVIVIHSTSVCLQELGGFFRSNNTWNQRKLACSYCLRCAGADKQKTLSAICATKLQRALNCIASRWTLSSTFIIGNPHQREIPSFSLLEMRASSGMSW